MARHWRSGKTQHEYERYRKEDQHEKDEEDQYEKDQHEKGERDEDRGSA